jgi:hypothetical protein
MANLFNASRLYEVLAAQGLLPDVSRQSPPSGADASFGYTTNRMMTPTRDLMAHEMVHAVQHNLLIDAAQKIQNKKWQREKISSEESSFLDAMQKMYGESFGRVGQPNKANTKLSDAVKERQMKDLYYRGKDTSKDSRQDKEWDRYRTDRKELEAWGVQAMLNKGSSLAEQEVPHLNPTMTQEFDILMSLYKQLPQATRQEFSEKRKQTIKENRDYDNFREPSGWTRFRFDSLTEDPFAPTIK